jgi:Ca-activated chloride channel homolog
VPKRALKVMGVLISGVVVVSVSLLVVRSRSVPSFSPVTGTTRNITAAIGPIRPDVPCAEASAIAKESQANMLTRVDVLFVLDVTGSMSPSIEGVKNGIKGFVSEFQQHQIDARVGLIGFRDRTVGEEPQLLMFNDEVFTADPDCFRNAVAKLSAQGGGDTPESDLDALVLASNQPFRPDADRKVIVLITDAPPKVPDQDTASIDEAILAIRKSKVTALYMIVSEADKSIFGQMQAMTGIPGGALPLTDAATGKVDFDRILPEIARKVSGY